MKLSGTGGVNELPELPGWDPRTGQFRIRRFKGPTASMIPASSSGTLANQLQTEGIRWSVESNENGFVIIRGEYGADELQPEDVPLSDRWFKRPGFEQKTLWELPKVQLIMNQFIPEVRAVIRQIFDALLKGERTFNYPEIPNVIPGGEEPINISALAAMIARVSGDVAAGQVFLEMFAERCQGVDTYRVEIHSVERVRVVPLSTSIKPSEANVNKLFSEAGMESSEEFSVVKAGFDLHPGFYLKGHPEVEEIGSSKRRITQVYEWCEFFSKFIYPDSPVA